MPATIDHAAILLQPVVEHAPQRLRLRAQPLTGFPTGFPSHARGDGNACLSLCESGWGRRHYICVMWRLAQALTHSDE